MLGLLAGGAGALLAAGGFRLLAGALPLGAWAEAARFDWTLFGAAMALALLAALGHRHSSRRSRSGAATCAMPSRGIRTASTGGRAGRIESGLVVAEVALAVLLAAGAGLLDPQRGEPVRHRPGSGDPRRRGASTSRQRRHATRRAPSRRCALCWASSSSSPASARRRSPASCRCAAAATTGHHRRRPAGPPRLHHVLPPRLPRLLPDAGHRRAPGARLHRARDRPDSAELAIVINEALAKKYFPGVDPIGRRIAERLRRLGAHRRRGGGRGRGRS